MSTTNVTGADIQALQDRLEITDVVHMYSSAIDSFDKEGLRSVFADDARAEFGVLDPVEGGDAIVEWIFGATSAIDWQHHLLSLYRVNIQGDTATALSNMTSHQVFDGEPDVARILVARYRDELTRTPAGWKISRKVGEFLCAETRRGDDAYLAKVAGSAPKRAPVHREP
jgi:hypothetical protein